MPPVKKKRKNKVKQLCSAYAGVSTVPVLEHAAKQMKWRLTDMPHPSASCYWVCQKDRVVQLVSELPATQLIARYPKMQAFCNKAPFAAILGQAAQLFPEEFYFWPRSYTIPADGEALKEAMGESEKNEFFIVKPDEGSQGDGIFLTSSWNDMVSRLGGFPPSGNWVVQHYMADPYLIDGMKFDLRLYVLLTSVGRSFRAFLSKEGLVRLCTAKYSKPTEKTRHKVTSHLTNYSLNKKSEGFVRGEEDDETGGEGSKRSLSSLLKLLRDNGEDVEDLWSNLTTLVANTIAAMHGPLMEAWEVLGSSGGNLFQVLGFDVLLDAQLNPILLEVNNQPSMAIDTPVPLDDDLCIEQGSMPAADGFDIPSWLDLGAVSGPSDAPRERTDSRMSSASEGAAKSRSSASRDTSTASSRAESDLTRSSYYSSSASSESADEEEPVDSCDASERLPTPPWANEILHDLDDLAKEFVKSSFQEKGKTNPAFSVEPETAANESGESSGDESDSSPSTTLRKAKSSSAISRQSSIGPSKGRSRKTTTSKIPSQSKSLSSLGNLSPPQGAVPKSGSKAASGTKGRTTAKTTTSSTAAAAKDAKGRASPKPPLAPRAAGTETPTETERASPSKPRAWGGGSGGSKKPAYVPSRIPKPPLRLNDSRDSNSSGNSGTAARPALKPSRSNRQIRNEELKQASVCTCKELQVPHRHISSPVDLFVKLGTLSAALELVDNLQQGNDAMAGERAREQFEECFPCLENDSTAAVVGDGENLVDPSGEQLCASPVLFRAYEVFKECTTTKGNSVGSRLRSIQPFKVRRLATTSKLSAPAGCLKTVDIDILYRQWTDRETPVQAAGSDFLNFVDLLLKLAERGLPAASPIEGLVCLLAGESGPGGGATPQT